MLVSVMQITVFLGTSNISRPRLPHLHSKGVRIESVNVNKGGASLLGNIWKCYELYVCVCWEVGW